MTTRSGVRADEELEIQASPPTRLERPRSDGPVRFARTLYRGHPIGAAISSSAAFVAVIVTMTWFRTGSFYARGDVAPFVRDGLRSELGGLWTHQNTAAGGPSYTIARSFEIMFTDLAHLLGGTDALAQRLLFAAIFAFAASGGAALLARVTRRPLLIAVGGVLIAFNPLTMINLPNFLIPVCIGMITWCVAFAIDAAAGGPVRARRGALILLAAAYVSANPPLLAVSLVTIAALPLVAAALTGTGTAGIRRSGLWLCLTAAWAIPLALWWLVPYASALRSASASNALGANTDVFSWSWTQAHSTLDRVLTLVAKWSWPDPKYASSGSAVGDPNWLWLSFALPIALFAAPLLVSATRRKAALWLVIGASTCALVAKGLNAPFRGVNAFAYRHLPLMWLLREPMSKIGALVALCSIAGWAMTIDALITTPPRRLRTTGRSGQVRATAAAVLLCAPLLFAWPMLTGSVVQPRDRVRLPAAWRQVARMVNDGPHQGKALVLPLDDFYQVPTTWGFYGADTLPGQLITRPTIVPNPQAYVGDTGDYDALVKTLQASLESGDAQSAAGALRTLGVSYVVLRKDIDYASPIRTVDMAQPATLAAGLGAVRGVRAIGSTSVATVYEVGGGNPEIVALNGTVAAPGTRSEALASLVASQPVGAAITTMKASESPMSLGQSWYVDVNESRLITSPHAGVWRYERHETGAPLLELASDPRGVLLHDPSSIQIAGTTLATRRDQVVAGAAPGVAVGVNDALIDLGHGASYARMTPGSNVVVYSAGSGSSLGAWGHLSDCNHRDDLSTTQAGLRADVVSLADRTGAMRLEARRNSACVAAPVAKVHPGDVVRVSLGQRSTTGAAPRSCLWFAGLKQCARLNFSAKRDGTWSDLTAVTRIPEGAGDVSMFVYADQPARGTAATQTWYRNVMVEPLVAGATQAVPPMPLSSGEVQLGPGPFPVSVHFGVDAPSIDAPSPAGNCARSNGKSLSELAITSTSVRTAAGSGFRLTAGHAAACVAFPVFGMHPDVTYEMQFDANVEAGSGHPRMCLWEETTKRCAALQRVQSGKGATTTYRYRGRVDPDASGWRLFVYADAGKRGSTITYTNLKLTPVADDALVLQPIAANDATPQVIYRRLSSDQYKVQVDNVKKPFLLALSDSFSNGWKLTGLDGRDTAAHFEIDGYRNGWAIDATGNLDLTISYAPARASHLALLISAATFILLLVLIPFTPSVTWNRRRSRRRRSRARVQGPRRVALPESWGEPLP